MKRCSNCSRDNPDEAQVCANCGTTLPLANDQTGLDTLPPGPMQVGPSETAESESPASQSPPEFVAPASAPLLQDPPLPPTQESAAPYSPPSPPPDRDLSSPLPPPPMAYQQTPDTGNQASPTAIWALVLGIAAFPCCGLIGLICAIMAIVLGNQARKEPSSNQQLARVGYILGIIAVIAHILLIIGVVIALVLRTSLTSP